MQMGTSTSICAGQRNTEQIERSWMARQLLWFRPLREIVRKARLETFAKEVSGLFPMGGAMRDFISRAGHEYNLVWSNNNSREKLGDELARENAASLVCKYLKTYNKILQNDTKACKTTVTEDQNDLDDTKEGFRNDVIEILYLFVNLTAHSRALREDFGESGCIEALMKLLNLLRSQFDKKLYTAASVKEKKSSARLVFLSTKIAPENDTHLFLKEDGQFILHSINVLYSCSDESDNVKYFKEQDSFFDDLMWYSNQCENVKINSDDSIHAMCQLIIANTFDESKLSAEPTEATNGEKTGSVHSACANDQALTSDEFSATSQKASEKHTLPTSSLCEKSSVVEKKLEEDKYKPTTEDHKKVINYLIQSLAKAIKRKSHLSPSGFSANELMLAIGKLANNSKQLSSHFCSSPSNDDSNEKNEREELKDGVLTSLLKLLKIGDKEEKLSAAKAIRALSFDKSNTEKFRQNTALIDRLLKCASNPKLKELQEEAEGALWQMGGKDLQEKRQKAVPVEEDGHVMLSYSWKQRNLVLKIEKKLRELGFRIWIDNNEVRARMKGDILETMAKAIENSAVVVICLSQSYKDSNNCRAEGGYAHELRKSIVPVIVEKGFKPSGWTGTLSGSRMRCDFSPGQSFRQAIQGLANELGENGKEEVQRPLHKLYDVEQFKKKIKGLKIRSTSFKQTDLQTEINHETLIFLNSLKEEVPEFFYRYASEILGITSPTSLMIFTHAFESKSEESSRNNDELRETENSANEDSSIQRLRVPENKNKDKTSEEGNC